MDRKNEQAAGVAGIYDRLMEEEARKEEEERRLKTANEEQANAVGNPGKRNKLQPQEIGDHWRDIQTGKSDLVDRIETDAKGVNVHLRTGEVIRDNGNSIMLRGQMTAEKAALIMDATQKHGHTSTYLRGSMDAKKLLVTAALQRGMTVQNREMAKFVEKETKRLAAERGLKDEPATPAAAQKFRDSVVAFKAAQFGLDTTAAEKLAASSEMAQCAQAVVSNPESLAVLNPEEQALAVSQAAPAAQVVSEVSVSARLSA